MTRRSESEPIPPRIRASLSRMRRRAQNQARAWLIVNDPEYTWGEQPLSSDFVGAMRDNLIDYGMRNWTGEIPRDLRLALFGRL